MRTSNTLNTAPPTKMITTSNPKATFSPPAIVQKSPWHSPLPYLFGGLAAMLGLIAFALLILACSYWRLSSNLNNEENGEGDVEAGDDKLDSAASAKAMPVYEEKIVVIMAGDVKPTFLATPISGRASSIEDGTKQNENMEKEMEDMVEKPKQETTESIDRD